MGAVVKEIEAVIPSSHSTERLETAPIAAPRVKSRVEELLGELPEQQVRSLNRLFDYFLESEFGHTLLGTKPISEATWLRYGALGHLLEFGIKTLARHQIAGDLNRFALFSIIDGQVGSLWMINKLAAYETIDTNLDLFKRVLGGDVSTREVMQGLCAGQQMYQVIRGNTALEGLLYGYGRENSLAVYECKEMRRCGKNAELSQLEQQLAWYSNGDWYPTLPSLVHSSSHGRQLGQAGSPCFLAYPNSAETTELVFAAQNISRSSQELLINPDRLRYCLTRLTS